MRLLGFTSNFVVFFLNLGVLDVDDIRKEGLDASSAGGVVWQHDLDLDTHDTLLEGNVSDSNVDIVESGLARADHVSGFVFHCLGSLLSQFTRNDDLATSGAFLGDALDDGVSGHSDGDALQQFEFKDFSLSSGGHAHLEDLGDLKFDCISFVSESLLDQRGELSDLKTILTENFGDLGGDDSDFGLDVGDSDFDSGVTSGGEGSGQEGVDFSVENTVGNELLLLVHLLELGLLVHFSGEVNLGRPPPDEFLCDYSGTSIYSSIS